MPPMQGPDVHPPSAIEIRSARPDDLPRVAALAAELVRFHHAIDPARYLRVEPLEPGYERFLRAQLDDPQAVVLVATRPGSTAEIVGYAYGRLEPRNWNDLLDACGKLHDVLVDERARGEGAGEALVSAMIARLGALGAPRVVLLSAWQNETAQRLFERLGFRRTMVEMTCELAPRDGG